jgi:hypothetical protein
MTYDELKAKIDAAFGEGQKASEIGKSLTQIQWEALENTVIEAKQSEVKAIFNSWLNGYNSVNLHQ